MNKKQQIIEHVVVTFLEAALAYLIVIPTVNWTKTVLAGAAGAGLSAVYNLLRQSNPTITSQVPPAASPAFPTPPTDPVSLASKLTGDIPIGN